MRPTLLTLSGDEMNRLEVMQRIAERRTTHWQASAILGLSQRQVERLYRAFREHGAAGLASKKRGRPSNPWTP